MLTAAGWRALFSVPSSAMNSSARQDRRLATRACRSRASEDTADKHAALETDARTVHGARAPAGWCRGSRRSADRPPWSWRSMTAIKRVVVAVVVEKAFLRPRCRPGSASRRRAKGLARSRMRFCARRGTVSTPYSSTTSPDALAGAIDRRQRARMFSPFSSERARVARDPGLDVGARMRPRSTSFMGGISGASPYTSRVPTVKLPGFGPPTSTSCIAMPGPADQRSPRRRRRAPSACRSCARAPAQGSLVTKASPSSDSPGRLGEPGDHRLRRGVQARAIARRVDADEQAVAVRGQQRRR